MTTREDRTTQDGTRTRDGMARGARRGWCPGALRPMASGDGLIVRVRARAGTLSLGAVIALCDAAGRFGNGLIDLTHRANLQIRGVRPEILRGLQDLLGELGLLDASPEAEAVRNVLVSPLAGVDPTEAVDVRPLALALEERLATDAALWRLPGKFGFLIDGGGHYALDGTRADIRLQALARDAMAVGLDRHGGPLWLGRTRPEAAPETAARAALAFLAVAPEGGRTRTRDLSDSAVETVRRALGDLDALDAPPPSRRGPEPAPGAATAGDHGFAAIAAAFGSMEANALNNLAEAALACGARDVRLSPWRMLIIPTPDRTAAGTLAGEAARLGFIVAPGDPLLRIAACPGAPACLSARLDTRSAARRLAALAPQFEGIDSIHVSGCVKGCMHPEPADLVLTATDDQFAVIRSGTAGDPPAFTIAPQALGRLPLLLGAQSGGEPNV